MALHLQSEGETRDLIRFVEAWAELGEPTPAARIAQARALVGLRLMDRAWVRLKDLAESDDADLEALQLAAQLFLDHGWPSRAREPLEKALALSPDNPRLQALWDRLDAPPVRPDDAMRDREEEDNLDALLPLAETYLATGATLKARSVLEGLKRAHPTHRRVDDLLWAIDGDFSVNESLAQLAERLGPDLGSLADLSDEVEHTESIPAGMIERELDDEPEIPRGFPALFRSVGTEDDTEEGEVTRALPMATADEMRSHGADETTDVFPDQPEAPPLQAGDTQILRVISRDGTPRIQKNDGPIHRPSEPAHPFDLGEYRRQMGMSSDLDMDMEAEDDDVVMFTHRESTDESAPRHSDDNAVTELLPDPTSSEVRIEFATKLRDLPTPEPRVRRAEAPSSEQPTAPARPAPVAVDDDLDLDITWRRRHSMTPWLAALAVLLLMGGVVLALALALALA